MTRTPTRKPGAAAKAPREKLTLYLAPTTAMALRLHAVRARTEMSTVVEVAVRTFLRRRV